MSTPPPPAQPAATQPPKPEDVKKFLESAPLYRKVACRIVLISPGNYGQILPGTISIHCDECDYDTNWELQTPRSDTRLIGYQDSASYLCANCKKRAVLFFFWGKGTSTQEVTFEKVGQYPPQEIKPPKALEKALGKHAPLYIKGMTCRHNSYGIGAHAYFRRLIEETTDDMLDLLANAMEETGVEKSVIQKVRDAKSEIQYERKIEIAAGVIPDHLRPGGRNPFALLHELLSRGVHTLSDEDCLDLVDGMQQALEFVFKELKIHMEERKIYAEGLRAIAEKVARRPKKA